MNKSILDRANRGVGGRPHTAQLGDSDQPFQPPILSRISQNFLELIISY